MTDNQCEETDVIYILGLLNSATKEEISKTICSSASTSCDLDHIPTWLLKLCFSEWLHVITNIIYLSLSTSTVPYNKLKMALNLTYLSKLIERVMVVRLTNFGSDKNTPFRIGCESLQSTSFSIPFFWSAYGRNRTIEPIGNILGSSTSLCQLHNFISLPFR